MSSINMWAGHATLCSAYMLGARNQARQIREVIKSGKSFVTEEPAILLDDNTLAIFLSNKVPLKNSSGEIIGMVGISINITERKKQEKELKEAKEKAEAALKAKEIAEAESRQKSTDLKNILHDLTDKKYYLTGKKYHGMYLTKREAECVVCLAQGCTRKQIAKILQIGERTTESYLQSAKNKLACRTRSELIRAAIECRFLEGVKPRVKV